MTKYPTNLDDLNSLPLVTDNVSPIVADDHNRLRQAIVAIQTELGTNPSGIHGTVKDKLDNLLASEVIILDIDGYYTSNNVEDALIEIGETFAGLSTAASDTTILDVDGYYDSTNVEGALREIGEGLFWYDSGTDIVNANSGNVLISSSSDISHPGSGTSTELFGLNAIGTGNNSVVIGNAATGSSHTDSVVMGQGASVTNVFSVAIGSSTTTGQRSVAVGAASTGNNDSVSIGYNTSATGSTRSTLIGTSVTGNSVADVIVIGYSADATASGQIILGSALASTADMYIGNGVTHATPNATAINAVGGSGTNVAGGSLTLASGKSTGSARPGDLLFSTSANGPTGTTLNALQTRAYFDGYDGYLTILDGITSPGIGANSEHFGLSSTASGDNTLSVGNGATANFDRGTAVGISAVASSTDGTAVGYLADGSQLGVAVGRSADANLRAVAVGYTAVSSGNDTVAIGSTASAAFADSIAIGRGTATTAAGQVVLGSSTASTHDLYFGAVTSISPDSASINPQGGSGTDIAGASLTLASGKSTGSARPGDLIFSTSANGPTGTTLNALQTRAYFDGYDGYLTVLDGISSFGAITGPDGTAAAPAYSFINDPNTGIYSDTSDTIQLATAGTLRLTLNAATGLFPDSALGLGANSKPWGSIFAARLTNTGATAVSIPRIDNDGSDIVFEENLVPDTDATYDLGTDAARWKDGYFSAGTLHIGNSLADEARLEYDGTRLLVNQETVFPVGSAGTPSITFLTDENSGFYRSSDNRICVATNGTRAFQFGESAHTTDASIFPDGNNSRDLGRADLRFNEVYTVNVKNDDSGTAVNIPTIALDAGTVSAPSLVFSGDLDTGIYSDTANFIQLATDGYERFHVAEDGYVKALSGITSPGVGTDSEAFGFNAIAPGTGGLAVGNGADSGPSTLNTAIGTLADCGASGGNLAVGHSASITGVNSVAIGKDSVAISSAVAIGRGANGSSNSIAIGNGSVATAGAQAVIGGTTGVTQVYFGRGVTHPTPSDVTIQVTGESGTDQPGINLTLASGRGTGDQLGGNIHFATSDAGGSGTTLNPLVDKLIIPSSITTAREGSQLVSTDTTGTVDWMDPVYAPSRQFTFYDEFLFFESGKKWAENLSGANAEVFGGGIADGYTDGYHQGLMALRTGTTASGVAIARSWQQLAVDVGTIIFETAVNIATLATTAEHYIFRIGLGDATTGADHTDGVYFEFDFDTSVNWRGVGATGGTRTKSGSIAVTEGTWTKLRFTVKDGTAEFYVDDVSTGTVSTNVPTTELTRFNIQMYKTNGTADREVYVDYFYFNKFFGVPR